MPTYEYSCRGCGHNFEILQSFNDKPVKKCPQCGKLKVERLFSGGGGFIFKGSGFYETDYKNTSEKKLAGDKAESKTESASEVKTETPSSGEGSKTTEKPLKTEKSDKPAKSETKSSKKPKK